ncbi:MAG: 30S ribosomal protein S20 [Epsilonproteobacteria bacterium]|nr:30S ribosomal protein S20 [Campylobacterota bacterium]
MANTKSAQKRVRQTKKRTERNRYYRTRVKTITKKVEAAVAEGNYEAALEAWKVANKKFQGYINKGILKKNTARRKISRLHHLVKSIEPKS